MDSLNKQEQGPIINLCLKVIQSFECFRVLIQKY